MTDETPERIAVRVLGEHRYHSRNAGGKTGCRGCRWTGQVTPGTDAAWAEYATHVAAVLAAELRAGGWLVEGETEVEWGAIKLDGEPLHPNVWTTDRDGLADAVGIAPDLTLASRLRTRYPDHVTEWRVEDGA